MRTLLSTLAAIALSAVAGQALAYDYSPAARRVLAQARAASGGEGWNALRGWQETGRWGEARYRLVVDPVRYGVRVELRRGEATDLYGYNGVGEWQVAPGGSATGFADKAANAQARTLAFFNAWGFYFPGRFAARGTHVGVKQHQGRSFDVLRIDPAGGLPRELWFDRRTHLLARMIDRNGPTPVVMELSDYRRAGPVQAPYRVAIDAGDPARPQVRVVEAVTFGAPDRAQFSLPPAPKALPPVSVVPP